MELFNSVGIEIEVEDIRGDNLNLGNLNFRIHRDASCESDGYTLLGMKIDTEESDKTLLKYIGGGRKTFGCELVTAGTLDTSDLNYLYTLKQITNMLISKGESPKSYRAGFHVHINVAYNLKILKSILRLSRHLEQVLYLLGGMGYDYRGFKNNSAYCRPITKFGPVCVKTGWKTFSQVFTIAELLKSTSTGEFKIKYGNSDQLRGSRYIPIRYHGINLLSLFTQGSLEFRMFNKSLNPYYLMAIIEFCKSFSEYAVKSSFESLKEKNLLKENSIFDVKGEKDREKIIDTFEHFLELSDVENKEVIEILYEILNTSSVDSLVIPKEYTYSHLIFHRQGNRSPVHWQGREYKPPVIDESSIVVPNFEDIHVLRENNNIEVGNRAGGIGLNTLRMRGENRTRQNPVRWDTVENAVENPEEMDEPQEPRRYTYATTNRTLNTTDINAYMERTRVNPPEMRFEANPDENYRQMARRIEAYVNQGGIGQRIAHPNGEIEKRVILNDGSTLIYTYNRNTDRYEYAEVPGDE